jgi:hypothetical protein
MSNNRATLLIKRACRLRWPNRHVAGLADLTRRPKATAASWISGRRQMPAGELQLLADVFRDDGHLMLGIAGELARVAESKRQQPRHARGFQIVKDWDGTGIVRDARWRGGRSKGRQG